jgi:hypothetical protein
LLDSLLQEIKSWGTQLEQRQNGMRRDRGLLHLHLLDPIPNDSGNRNGRRRSVGGRDVGRDGDGAGGARGSDGQAHPEERQQAEEERQRGAGLGSPSREALKILYLNAQSIVKKIDELACVAGNLAPDIIGTHYRELVQQRYYRRFFIV